MSKERIEEVAREIWARIQCWSDIRESQTAFVEYFKAVITPLETQDAPSHKYNEGTLHFTSALKDNDPKRSAWIGPSLRPVSQ